MVQLEHLNLPQVLKFLIYRWDSMLNVSSTDMLERPTPPRFSFHWDPVNKEAYFDELTPTQADSGEIIVATGFLAQFTDISFPVLNGNALEHSQW